MEQNSTRTVKIWAGELTGDQAESEIKNLANIQKQQENYINDLNYSLKSRFWIFDFTLPVVIGAIGVLSSIPAVIGIIGDLFSRLCWCAQV